MAPFFPFIYIFMFRLKGQGRPAVVIDFNRTYELNKEKKAERFRSFTDQLVRFICSLALSIIRFDLLFSFRLSFFFLCF